jgi:zinc protease
MTTPPGLTESQNPSSSGSGPTLMTGRLDNGLDVVVIPDRRAPVVTHMVWYRNGSADDPVGKSGIAHFLEHLMFKGTDRFPAGAFSKAVSAVGGQENAFTSYDITAYFQRVAPEHLPRMMEMEADRMTGLTLSDDVVNPERDVVLEERRMRVEADPGSQLHEAMLAALYMHHPYRIPIIGWMHEIEGLRREDALAYYRRFYTPDNAALILAGDIDPDDGLRLARVIYGKVAPTGARAERQRPQEPEPKAARRVSVQDVKVEQPFIHRMYLAPSERLGESRQVRALEVLAHILGHGTTARLYRALVMDDGPAAGAGAYYSPHRFDLANLGVYAYPRAGVTLEALEAALDGALAKTLSEGVSPEELARAQTRLVASTIYQQDSQQSLAYRYGQAMALGADLASVAAWPQAIEAVTAQDVLEAARAVMTPSRSVTGWLLSQPPGQSEADKGAMS